MQFWLRSELEKMKGKLGHKKTTNIAINQCFIIKKNETIHQPPDFFSISEEYVTTIEAGGGRIFPRCLLMPFNILFQHSFDPLSQNSLYKYHLYNL